MSYDPFARTRGAAQEIQKKTPGKGNDTPPSTMKAMPPAPKRRGRCSVKTSTPKTPKTQARETIKRTRNTKQFDHSEIVDNRDDCMTRTSRTTARAQLMKGKLNTVTPIKSNTKMQKKTSNCMAKRARSRLNLEEMEDELNESDEGRYQILLESIGKLVNAVIPALKSRGLLTPISLNGVNIDQGSATIRELIDIRRGVVEGSVTPDQAVNMGLSRSDAVAAAGEHLRQFGQFNNNMFPSSNGNTVVVPSQPVGMAPPPPKRPLRQNPLHIYSGVPVGENLTTNQFNDAVYPRSFSGINPMQMQAFYSNFLHQQRTLEDQCSDSVSQAPTIGYTDEVESVKAEGTEQESTIFRNGNSGQRVDNHRFHILSLNNKSLSTAPILSSDPIAKSEGEGTNSSTSNDPVIQLRDKLTYANPPK